MIYLLMAVVGSDLEGVLAYNDLNVERILIKDELKPN